MGVLCLVTWCVANVTRAGIICKCKYFRFEISNFASENTPRVQKNGVFDNYLKSEISGFRSVPLQAEIYEDKYRNNLFVSIPFCVL
jgi:hypothetical protein